MAAGEIDSEVVERGVRFLMNAPRAGNQWEEKAYTAVGFPRVFYLGLARPSRTTENG